MPPTTPEIRTALGAMDMERHLADPALRQAWVTPMFDLIAPRYDNFTRAFSFGMDRRWKDTLVTIAQIALPRDAVVADVATGTGDLAFALSHVRPDVTIAALDVSSEMLIRARARRDREFARRIAIASGDLAALPFPSASVDAVTAGYALRNAPDWRASLSELARVIRPGGHLLTLDFYSPASPVWRAMFLTWLSIAGRTVGWWWHREPRAYSYIARSIAHFTTADGFSQALEKSSFSVKAVQRHLGGGISLHHAVRR